MGFIATALIVGTVGVGAALLIKESLKELDRKSTPCNFDNGISQEEFNEIIKNECQEIKRITDFTVSDTTLRAYVKSQSGISEWKFKIDFNDYGKITGNYWLSSNNNDSQIPEVVAKRIKNSIQSKLNESIKTKSMDNCCSDEEC